MDVALGVVLLGVLMAGLLAGFVLLARRARRGGTAGAALSGAMAAYNEAWHGPAHEAHIEIQTQSYLVTPIESPDKLWALRSTAPISRVHRVVGD